MSASSSSSLPVPADFLLPHIPSPLCGDELETNVARTGDYSGNRFYKCRRYDSRKCRFFDFQTAYVRRMSNQQIARARQQAGMQPGNQVGQVAPVANQNAAPLFRHAGEMVPGSSQPPIQTAPPHQTQLANQLVSPAASAQGAHALAAVAVLLSATNLIVTVLALLFVMAMYFGSGK